ncbi:MAG TPA: LptE family protein [Chitinophagales bacterium]|nr:LptE family protein [Chitinophagales bacterium]
MNFNFQLSIFNFRTGAFLLFLGSLFCVLSGCKVYSFTGASLSPDVKSVTVELFQNRASNGPASLSQTFTDKLKFKMQTEANLRQVAADGDLQFSGSVTGYVFTSDAPVANATSGLNKLTITVQVHYVNTKDEKDTWDQAFSRYAQYSSSEELISVEERLINEINTQLVDDIFQKALVKW